MNQLERTFPRPLWYDGWKLPITKSRERKPPEPSHASRTKVQMSQHLLLSRERRNKCEFVVGTHGPILHLVMRTEETSELTSDQPSRICATEQLYDMVP